MSDLKKAAIRQSLEKLPPGSPIPIHLWGSDHFSTLGYLECRATDNKGVVDHRHMRGQRGAKCTYPTRLAHGIELPNHSDWDCLDDIEEAGLIENAGTGLHPVIRMTDKGWLVAAALRAHKASGGSFGNFSFQV